MRINCCALVSDDNFGFFHKTKDQRQSKKLPATIGNGFMNNLAQTHSALSNLGQNLSQLSPANAARALAMMTLLFSGSTAAAIDSRAPSETLLTPVGSEVLLLAETRIRGTRELGEALLREGQRYIDAGEQNISRGQEEIRAGQAEIRAGQAEIRAGQAEIRAGQAEIRAGQAEIRAGQAEIRAGQAGMRNAQAEIEAGQAEIEAGQAEIEAGQAEIEAGKQKLQKIFQDDVNLGIQNGVETIDDFNLSGDVLAENIDNLVHSVLEVSLKSTPDSNPNYEKLFNAIKAGIRLQRPFKDKK